MKNISFFYFYAIIIKANAMEKENVKPVNDF